MTGGTGEAPDRPGSAPEPAPGGTPAPDDTGWALSVPRGYRVGAWEVTAPVAAGNWGSVYAARRSPPADAPPAGEDQVPAGGDRGDARNGTGEGSAAPATAALKFIATTALGPGRSHELRKLAEKEAEFSRRAAHDRLIRVLETHVVTDADRPRLDGAVVLVMERAAHSVQDLLDSAAGAGPLPQAGRIVTQICEGLAHLHAAGWVHADLKPANVLIMDDGSVRLADFGLVSRMDGTHGYAPPLGSPDYLPPERWRDSLGEHGVTVRPTADIWALGVTAHQILTGGHLPFPGATAGARTAAAQEYAAGRAPLRPHPALGDGWRDFVTRCLAPDHASRAAGTAGDLAGQARGLSAAGPAGRRPLSRRSVLTAATAAVVLGAGAGGGWWLTGREDTGEERPTARITVYNVETACRTRADERLRACSMGLALDPWRKYEAGNVSEHRIHHDDVLTADCVVYDGDRVADETGVGTRRWYRVAVAREPSGYAWFPAVRTKEEPTSLPTCAARPSPSRS
ncbi:serine/threonine-protein kinase [Streptomyces zingiberis]|uniref:non-specific serine/threonine protein kinase n=1 Tax=Streptomyces zingiberis TaxID=2053010 RepID=A0ABX1BPH2_9ACTN|nr:serine/threonine-protein kinase [Streptomyces zingiberis]NJP99609.1 serine/threonine protein kinase [Streptomyces zingiberis]